MKAILLALACFCVSTVLAVISVFVVALSTGPSIAAGERAALVLAALEILLGIGSVLTFAILSGSLQIVPRILGTLALGMAQAIVLTIVFVFALILLNR